MVKTNLEILLIDTGIMPISQKDIPTLPANQTTGMLIHEAVEMLKRVNETLNTILARMKELAKSLLEYPVVRAMDSSVGGIGISCRLADYVRLYACDNDSDVLCIS